MNNKILIEYWKKAKKIFIQMLIVSILTYMQVSTYSIMTTIEDAFYSSDYYIKKSIYEEKAQYYNNNTSTNYVVIDDNEYYQNIYAHFDRERRYNEANKIKPTYIIDLKLKQPYSFNNFFYGCMWVTYTVEVRNNNGESESGSRNIPVKIWFKRNGLKWKVTEINEMEGFRGLGDLAEFWLTFEHYY